VVTSPGEALASGQVLPTCPSIEFCPDDGVVGGPGDFTRSHVDFSGMAARGHDPGRQDMVDAPAEVSLEGVAKEIPIGVLNDIRVKLAEDIDESPGCGLLVSVAGVDVKIGIVDAFFRMVDIDGFGGDIEVANPDCRFMGIQGGVEIGAETSKPGEFQSVFLGSNRVPLRDVTIDDGNPAYDGLDDAEVFVVLPFMQAVNDLFPAASG
jgi:hypothetical protein